MIPKVHAKKFTSHPQSPCSISPRQVPLHSLSWTYITTINEYAHIYFSHMLIYKASFKYVYFTHCFINFSVSEMISDCVRPTVILG